MQTTTFRLLRLRTRRIATKPRCIGNFTAFPIASPRTFSSTKVRDVRTTEMSESQFAEVKVNRQRLWRELHETCEWGKGERWGE